jgi:hypothetical protein
MQAAKILSVLAFAAIAATPALAQSGAARPGTEAALQCLLELGPKGCQEVFAAQARPASDRWVWPNQRRDFDRGALLSSSFWGKASADNVFDQRVMTALTADEFDIFDVKFAHQEWTFYIAPPDADGKIRHVAVRIGAPHDLIQLHA